MMSINNILRYLYKLDYNMKISVISINDKHHRHR